MHRRPEVDGYHDHVHRFRVTRTRFPPSLSSVRIVVTGLLGQYAFGGVTWDYLQYLLGFRGLGHDVWYLEDSGAWPYDPVRQTISEDCTYNVNYLHGIMTEFGFGDRWIYRNGADGKFHGAGEAAARGLIKNAALLVNVSSAGWLKDYDFGVKHQMFIDGDPMFCQVNLLDPKHADYAARVRAHDSHFTFGLNVGRPGCLVPDTGIRWKKTVQPIALEQWPVQKDDGAAHGRHDRFTTVMNWASYAPIEWQGKPYGQKDLEFDRFKLLPQKTSQRLEMAMGQGVGSKRPTEELRALGWIILEAGDGLERDPSRGRRAARFLLARRGRRGHRRYQRPLRRAPGRRARDRRAIFRGEESLRRFAGAGRDRLAPPA
jgi:hypothetical protein